MLLLLYLLHLSSNFSLLRQAPPVFKVVGGVARGYGRDISPAAALDLAAGGGNVVIVDIRTDREKENGGVPDLPSGNRWACTCAGNTALLQTCHMACAPACGFHLGFVVPEPVTLLCDHAVRQ